MEIQYTNTKRPKLTVSTKRFTVKLNKDLHDEEENSRLLELFKNIKTVFDDLGIEETYRGVFNHETQTITLHDNSNTEHLSFKINQFD